MALPPEELPVCWEGGNESATNLLHKGLGRCLFRRQLCGDRKSRRTVPRAGEPGVTRGQGFQFPTVPRPAGLTVNVNARV